MDALEQEPTMLPQWLCCLPARSCLTGDGDVGDVSSSSSASLSMPPAPSLVDASLSTHLLLPPVFTASTCVTLSAPMGPSEHLPRGLTFPLLRLKTNGADVTSDDLSRSLAFCAEALGR